MKKTFKLLNNLDKNAIAIYHGRKIFKEEFLSHVELTKNHLLLRKYAINLCENRYHFLVTFAACATLGQISLFPSSKAKKEIERLSESYFNSYLINDEDVIDLYQQNNKNECKKTKNFDISAQQTVAILFTSGTTGEAKKNPKTWGQLNESAIRVGKRLWPKGVQGKCIIATVPPQHMFGFETSIIYPLTLGIMMHDGYPFYPLDIQQIVLETPEPKILITTPLHLKACIGLRENWHNIDAVISATSLLSNDIANEAEKILNTHVFEMYGCSESGAIATRQINKGDKWELLEDYDIKANKNNILLKAVGYKNLITISDQIKMIDDRFFYLLGRNSDLVKIGGKRESLSGLSYKLKKIDGVDDGIFFIPKEDTNKRVRLAALVVSSTLTRDQIIPLLSQTIDSVFLPRPLKVVASLPYNKLGKLPFNNLIKMIDGASLDI